MRQLINRPPGPPAEIEMKQATIQRILLDENRKDAQN